MYTSTRTRCVRLQREIFRCHSNDYSLMCCDHLRRIHFNSIRIQMWREMFTVRVCVCAAKEQMIKTYLTKRWEIDSIAGAAINKNEINRFSMFAKIILFLISFAPAIGLRRVEYRPLCRYSENHFLFAFSSSSMPRANMRAWFNAKMEYLSSKFLRRSFPNWCHTFPATSNVVIGVVVVSYNTARAIKVCSTQIWMRDVNGDAITESRCAHQVPRCSPSNFFVRSSSSFYCFYCNSIFPVHYFHFLLFICFRPDALALSLFGRLLAVGSVMCMNGFACAICLLKGASIHTVHYQEGYCTVFKRADETKTFIYFQASHSVRYAHRKWGYSNDQRRFHFIRRCLSSILFLLFALQNSHCALGGGAWRWCDAAQRLIQKRAEHVIGLSLSMC